MNQTTLDSLREIRRSTRELIELNSFGSAVFWADKAVSLSSGDFEDVLMLGRCLYSLGEYGRLCALLEKHDATPKDLRCLLLHAKGLAMQQSWDDCLQLLQTHGAWSTITKNTIINNNNNNDDVDNNNIDNHNNNNNNNNIDNNNNDNSHDVNHQSPRTLSQLWLLQGRAFEALANRSQATDAYRNALQFDAYCFEAFECLVDHNLLLNPVHDELPTESTALPHLPSSSSNDANGSDLNLNQSISASFSSLDIPPSTPISSSSSSDSSNPSSTSASTSTSSSTSNSDETLSKVKRLLASVATDAQACPWIRSLYACKIWQHGSFSAPHDDLSESHCLQFPPLPSAFRGNTLVLAARAERFFYTDHFQAAYDLSKQVIEADAYHNFSALAVYVSSLVELEKTNELYYCAHKLVQASPALAVSWYAIGCYYHLVGKFLHARRYFGKAVEVDPGFGPTWIGFGHSFSHQGEPDQALAAYYTASRIMPGSHLPLLYIAMEYRRLSNHRLAATFLGRASALCSADPLLWSEHGVNAYLEGDYRGAVRHFEQCVAQLSRQAHRAQIPALWEPVLFNLGHCHRKLGRLPEAREMYARCLEIHQKATTYTALGFVDHLLGNLELAIQNYHHALAIVPGDAITNGLLDKAIKELLLHSN